MNNRRWILFALFLIGSIVCSVSLLRLGAANPTAGSIGPTSEGLRWAGTAAGGTSNGESTCVEGVNCDTFTLTVTGEPADWAGKRIAVSISWVVLASDYDLYIHKGSNSGPLITSSTGGPPSTSETANINPSVDGTGVFTVRVVYFAASAGDQYTGAADVKIDEGGGGPTPTPPPLSDKWHIVYHGTCCEGNLAAAGNDTYVLLPELATGNDIKRSSDGGKTWVKKYPPVDVSQPYGIEGDLQAIGNDIIFFGTEVSNGVSARSSNRGDTFTVTQFPVAFVANDQAWAYLGPFENIAPVGQAQTVPYVIAGWYRIGSVALFSFDGGLTYPVQTPLVGNNGSGPIHVVCRDNARPPSPGGDTRIANAKFARQKAGRHGAWGTDRKFYWTEPAGGELYVCKTSDFGVNWTGIKHPLAPGPAANYVVTHTAFDDRGTLYVLHGDKLYVSFNQGQSMAYVHTLPRFGNARRSDAGADQYFVVDNGTIHIGLLEAGEEGRGRVYYLRGIGVDTPRPIWQEELVDVVDNVRLDFVQIVLNGNGIPTISYTTPGTGKQVTTASRDVPLPLPPARLLNISTRAQVQTGDRVLIGGFIVTGNSPRNVIVRAIGPSLNIKGEPVAGRLNDPTLELYQQGNSTPIATNDNWKENQAAVEATTLAPPDDRESAIVRTLEPGAYTAIVRGKAEEQGIGLAEVYDIGAAGGSQLANLSTRGFIGVSDNVMIGGFIAGPNGTGPAKVAVRGIGPSLDTVPNAVRDPYLEFRDANGTIIEENDNWEQSPGAAQLQAAGLAPKNAAEAAVWAPSLAPGTYTAVLRGKGADTGVGLVEVYNVP